MLGEILGNYRVLRKLGEGGMGTVYLAEHKLIGRKAAVKVLLPEYLRQKDIVDRFFNEARATTGIHHPGIVQVLDFGQKDDSIYLVMEYLQGEPLDRRLKRQRRLPIAQALRIAHHCASALAAAHAAGVIHRDLKPGNIFLVSDPQVDGGERAKILDFGIAKLTNDRQLSPVKTRTGSMVGTPVYMSPEQCRGAGEIDHRSDIYALGCVLFRMICGRPPFVAQGVGEIIASHLREPAPSPCEYEAGVPPELEAVILTTLAKSPDDRHATMSELAAELQALGRLPAVLEAGMGASGAALALGVSFGMEDGLESLVSGEAPLAVVSGASGKDRDVSPLWPVSSQSLPSLPSSSSQPRESLPGEVITRRLHPAGGPFGEASGQVPDQAGQVEEPETIAMPMKTTLGGAASERFQAPSRARKASIVLVALVAAAIAAGAVVLIKSRGASRPDAASRLTSSAAAGAASGAAAAEGSVARPGAARAAPDQTGPMVLPFPEAERVEQIEVVIDSEPDGAAVYRDGRKLGHTPYSYATESVPDEITMELRRRGYHSKSISFSAARGDAIHVELEPRPSAKPQRPRGSSGTPSATSSGTPSATFSGTPSATPAGKGKEPTSKPALDDELLSR
jgi:eukaryotic-like serine/threonine-protein kinase